MRACRPVARLAAWMLFVGLACAQAAAESYKAPFELSEQRAIFGRPLARLQGCPQPPAPIRDHTYEVFYSDSAQSVRDEAKFRAQLDRAKGLRDYTSALNRMADDYVASKPPDPARAACVLEWLQAWAEGGALLGKVESWARWDTLWFVHVGASLAYLKIRDDPSLDPAAKRKVTTWLGQMARAAIGTWQTIWGSRPTAPINNHSYWVGASAVLAGVAGGDRELFDFGVKMARRGLASVTPEGALPGELRREGRAFYYHLWAMEPLMLIVATARANGIDLSRENNAALDRIVGLLLRAHADPGLFQKLTGARQTDDAAAWPQGAHQIGFAEIYLHFNANEGLNRLVARLRPVNVPYIVGNYTLLFGKSRR